VISPDAPTLSRGLLLAYGSLAFPLAAAFIALQVIVPTYYAEIIAISVWFLLNPSDTAGAGYLLLWTVAIYVAGTLSIVPTSAWAAELSQDYNQRSRITGFRVGFGLAGTLAALIVPAILADILADNESAALGETLLVISCLVIITLIIATVWAAVRVPDNADISLPHESVKAAWALMRSANPFRQLLISFLLNAVGNAIPATLFLLFVTHVLKVPDKAGVFLFIYFVAAAIAVPFWVSVSRRLGKHRTWSVAIVIACAFFLWAPLLDADTVFWFYVVLCAMGHGDQALVRAGDWHRFPLARVRRL